MMSTVISAPHDATPAWLTHVLRGAGMLPQGEVIDIQYGANPAFNSSIAHLTVTCSADAIAHFPRQLLLKLNAQQAGEYEIAFYQHVMGLAEYPPALVRCYHAAYDETTGDSILLLGDLSATHQTPIVREDVLALRGVPSGRQLHGMIDALARFHAYWWQRLPSKFGTVRPWYTDEDHFKQHIQRREREWSAFITSVGDPPPDHICAIYESTLVKLPHLWENYLKDRVLPHRHITLSNGDCYFAQFLCPLEGDPDNTFIIDFQDVSGNFGAYDLVYMFATFWTPQQRQDREPRLLRQYHETLVKHGVTDYSYDQLITDYKFMIALMIFDPIWNQTSGAPKSYWWPKLQCLIGAFRDLNCADLLSELSSNA